MPVRFTPNARARMHRCQVYASAFISSVVGLRLPYPLFVIVSVLSLSCLGWLLKSVLAEVEDGLLRYVKQRFSLPPLGEELHPDHPLLGRRRAHNGKNGSSSSIALHRCIILGKMHKQFAPPSSLLH